MARCPSTGAAAGVDAPSVRIRMYRLSVGDCFLITLTGSAGAPFRILIDCGIHQSKKGGSTLVRKAVKNLLEETEGRIDLLVITHEHADHISGFRLAKKDFRDSFTVATTWFAWTENSKDPLAQELAGNRYQALRALTGALTRQRLQGADPKATALLESLLGFIEPDVLAGDGRQGFYGGGGGAHSRDSFKTIETISKAIEYKEPGGAPVEILEGAARLYVLGPPRNREQIGRSAPQHGSDEVYPFGAYRSQLATVAPMAAASPQTPFDPSVTLPLQASKAMDFFQRHYWQDRVDASDREADTQRWRRIEQAWLESAEGLALKLDEDTNNTSLVLAIELGPADLEGPVLLFAADAQVGNWMSWRDVTWQTADGRQVTGPDLLRRTIVYKVGHHGSHNATLQKDGLEIMDALELALLPTDVAMAEKVGWGRFPLPSLVERLQERTDGRVVRTDEDAAAMTGRFTLKTHDLYYEVSF